MRFAALILALACVFATDVAAQEMPELDRVYLRLATNQRTMNHLGNCLVDRDPERARRMFDAPTGSEEYLQLSREIFEQGDSCLFGATELRARSVMAHGAMARRLIELDAPSLRGRTTDAVAANGGGSLAWKWQDLTPVGYQQTTVLARCLVDRHGDKVEAVIATRPTSNEEREAFNAMRAEISDCIPSNESRILQPQILRAALAISYYTAARKALRNVSFGTDR